MSSWDYFKGRLLYDLFWLGVSLGLIVMGALIVYGHDWWARRSRKARR